MKEIIIRYKVRKILRYVISSFIIALSCIFNIFDELEPSNDVGYHEGPGIFLSIICLLMFGVGSCLLTYKILWHRMYFIISDEGIQVVYSKRKRIIIGWDYIYDMFIFDMDCKFGVHYKFVFIRVNDIKPWGKVYSKYKIKILNTYYFRKHLGIVILTALTNEKPEEVLEILDKYWCEWKINNKNKSINNISNYD